MSRWKNQDVQNLFRKRNDKLPKRYAGFLPCQNEHALANSIVIDLNQKPEVEIAWKHYNGGFYDEKKKAWRKGSEIPGFPDVGFILLLGGRICGFECKKDGGYMTKSQKEWGERLLKMGCIWACVWSFEQYEYEWEKQKHKLLL